MYVDRMGEDRRGEHKQQSFEVVPTRIGGSSSQTRSDRRRRAPIIILIVIAVLIPAIALIGPRIVWRPEIDLSFLRPTPTPVPSKTPRPISTPTELATPAPMLTVGDGPHPTEPFPVDVGGLRLADPKTGALGPTFGLRGDNDAIFRSPTGGWWCVCFTRVQDANQETVTAEIKRVDSAGRQTQQATIGTYRSAAPPPIPGLLRPVRPGALSGRESCLPGERDAGRRQMDHHHRGNRSRDADRGRPHGPWNGRRPPDRESDPEP